MAEYTVIVSKHVAGNLLKHVEFLSNVSTEAAGRFIQDYEAIITRLEDNPFQYQIDTSFENSDEYRRAIFSKWYKCLFVVEGNIVYLDAVVDCRQDD
ncbi:MAG: hypothetical protein J5715_04140 [Clostridiales bacterium]|nr:hypothetical protein [Clostridiales bacterium]